MADDTSGPRSGATYASSGVDLALYAEGMARLPAHMRRTQCPRVISAEGGFAVSAERKEGRTARVSVRAGVRQALRLADPFGGRRFESSRPVEVRGGEFRVVLQAGETLELRAAIPAGR